MRRQIITPRFSKRLTLFLRRHPTLEPKVEALMSSLAYDSNTSYKAHSLHGEMRGSFAIRISQQYRLVFVLEPDAVIFIDIGSHDEVY